MMHFEWWWAWLLLPLPLLLRFLLKPARGADQAALRVPFLADFERPRRGAAAAFGRWPLYLALLGWLLLIAALSRPQWLGELAQAPVSGRDLMLAVDISGSMKEIYFALGGRRVSRIDAAKAVGADFIVRREGDRIGLIVFGGRPYLQMPLSFDLKAVSDMLAETFIGLAEERETAIGDAIGLALKRLRRREGDRVLILLTDGANNAGSLSPQVAADLAARENMKIYTIGIGPDIGDRARVNLFRRGSELDEETLKAIAGATGGRYFRARNTAELAEIYRLLDRIEAVEHEAATFRTRRALYPWPLAAAALIAGFVLLAPARVSRPRGAV